MKNSEEKVTGIVQISWQVFYRHREDDEFPLIKLSKFLREKYGDKVEVESSGLTALQVDFYGSEDDIKASIVEFFKSELDLPQEKQFYTLTFQSFKANENSQKNAETDKGSKPKKQLSFIDEMLHDDSDPTRISYAALKKAKKLIGCDEFKSLMEEFTVVMQEIKNNKTMESFRSRVYLFAINDGCGLTTACTLTSELLHELGVNSLKTVEEIKVDAKQGENDDAFCSVLQYMEQPMFGGFHNVLCADVSEWISDLRSKPFRNFLRSATEYLKEGTLVLRIPYVNEEVLNDAINALNDVIFVKAVSFPPYNSEELRELAKKRLLKYRFKMTSNAWSAFDERIAYEKSDGRFYGARTVEKVIDELIYMKQVENTVGERYNRVITLDEATKILAVKSEADLTAEQMLGKMIGCEYVKNRIKEIVAQIQLAKIQNNGKTPCIHMRFVGNPGTGKTTIARIIGKLLKEKGILRNGDFFECSGRSLCGRFVGETAPKTASICRDAYGSVLFIDEAYSLHRTDIITSDFGKEAIDTLVGEMENHRSDLLVIMAGYPDEMEILLKANPGLESRMPYTIEFPNFSREELFEIFKGLINGFNYDDDLLDEVKIYIDSLSDSVINAKAFGNARFIRNLFERIWAKAALRTQNEGDSNVCLKTCDLLLAVSDKEFNFTLKKKNVTGVM